MPGQGKDSKAKRVANAIWSSWQGLAKGNDLLDGISLLGASANRRNFAIPGAYAVFNLLSKLTSYEYKNKTVSAFLNFRNKIIPRFFKFTKSRLKTAPILLSLVKSFEISNPYINTFASALGLYLSILTPALREDFEIKPEFYDRVQKLYDSVTSAKTMDAKEAIALFKELVAEESFAALAKDIINFDFNASDLSDSEAAELLERIQKKLVNCKEEDLLKNGRLRTYILTKMAKVALPTLNVAASFALFKDVVVYLAEANPYFLALVLVPTGVKLANAVAPEHRLTKGINAGLDVTCKSVANFAFAVKYIFGVVYACATPPDFEGDLPLLDVLEPYLAAASAGVGVVGGVKTFCGHVGHTETPEVVVEVPGSTPDCDSVSPQPISHSATEVVSPTEPVISIVPVQVESVPPVAVTQPAEPAPSRFSRVCGFFRESTSSLYSKVKSMRASTPAQTTDREMDTLSTPLLEPQSPVASTSRDSMDRTSPPGHTASPHSASSAEESSEFAEVTLPGAEAALPSLRFTG